MFMNQRPADDFLTLFARPQNENSNEDRKLGGLAKPQPLNSTWQRPPNFTLPNYPVGVISSGENSPLPVINVKQASLPNTTKLGGSLGSFVFDSQKEATPTVFQPSESTTISNDSGFHHLPIPQTQLNRPKSPFDNDSNFAMIPPQRNFSPIDLQAHQMGPQTFTRVSPPPNTIITGSTSTLNNQFRAPTMPNYPTNNFNQMGGNYVDPYQQQVPSNMGGGGSLYNLNAGGFQVQNAPFLTPQNAQKKQLQKGKPFFEYNKFDDGQQQFGYAMNPYEGNQISPFGFPDQQQQQRFNFEQARRKPVIIDEGKQRYTGRLKFFDEGKNYGFIVMDDDGSDIFVHYDDLSRANIDKELLKTARLGNMIRLSFSCMQYIGKYEKSRKAIDIQMII